LGQARSTARPNPTLGAFRPADTNLRYLHHSGQEGGAVTTHVRTRIGMLVAVAASLVPSLPVGAVPGASRSIAGATSGAFRYEWFNRPYDTGPDRFFGKL